MRFSMLCKKSLVYYLVWASFYFPWKTTKVVPIDCVFRNQVKTLLKLVKYTSQSMHPFHTEELFTSLVWKAQATKV